MEQGLNVRPGGLSSASPTAPVVAAVPVSIPDAVQIEALETAAKALLDACEIADAHENLSDEVDGSLMDALSDALDWRFPVIWTPAQVEALNTSQGGYGHPYTCGGDRGDERHRAYADENGEDNGQLIATKRGWVCPVCDYRQFWAHGIERSEPPQGIETGTAKTEGLGPKDESPVGGNADAPTPTLVNQGEAEILREPQTGWLIENEDEPEWIKLDPSEPVHEISWTRDSIKALRFARQCDAEAYLQAVFGGDECFRITEHRWG